MKKAILICFVIASCLAYSFDPRKVLNEIKGRALKLADFIKVADKFPLHTKRIEEGKKEYIHYELGEHWEWVSGFWGGSLWELYEYSNEPIFKSLAIKYTETMEKSAVGGNHDVGFMIYYSFGKGYFITNKPKYREIALRGASTLSERWVPSCHSMRSWGSIGSERVQVIIDNLMNLELFFFAAQETGNHTYYDMAVSHFDTNIRDFVRPDFSHYHEVDYSMKTGEVTGKLNPQGLAPETTWSRGQGWAIHGFAQAYRCTLDRKYLKLATNMAIWYMEHLPEDLIPYWDFDAPKGDPRDSSASAIAASGMIEIYHLSGDRRMLDYALELLDSLVKNYMSDPDWNDHLLNKQAYSKPHGTYDLGFIVGDYYFIEALHRLVKWNCI